MSHTPNPAKIAHVPARVNHDPLLTTRKTDSYPRVNHNPNTQKIVHVPTTRVTIVGFDNFGVKYINQKDTDPLIMTLQKKYSIKMNCNGDYYLGMTLE